MFDTLLHTLHVLPLALIIASVIGVRIYKSVTGKVIDGRMVNALLLVLCSVGIVAGDFVHHGELLHIFDPCYGYAATLLGVAFKSTREQKSRA